MDLEVVGRHALLFDDDATAAFMNTTDALVEWNSLLIDRYDVRHLLSSPPPPRRRRSAQQSHTAASPPFNSLESELDHERYLDLPSPSDEQELDDSAKPVHGGSYNAVAFSYGNTDDSVDQKLADTGLGDSGFRPPFPVPECLLLSLPSTEKVHQIIARTAMFVSKHGGQSEIVLRVKQGDNPTFGFLMPDHQLHAYFRFLVDNQELLQSDTDGKPQDEKKNGTEYDQTDGIESGALSLLGCVYGSGEDEDGVPEDARDSKERVPGETCDAVGEAISTNFEKTGFPVNAAGKNEASGKNFLPSKEKAPALRRNLVTGASKAGTTSGKKKVGEALSPLSTPANKSQNSALPIISKVLEPPSDLKRLVDKIVEFIVRNGKQFEAVLVEQDSKHGRFPFLLPSNQYHGYYLKALQKAQELKLTGKSFLPEKDEPSRPGPDKKTFWSKEDADALSLGSSCDMPYDSERKEKFKMVIGKSKKDGQDLPSKDTRQQIGIHIDAAAAAAILQAATRGIKNPNFGILSSTSLNGDRHVRSSEGEQASSLASQLSSKSESVIPKSDKNGKKQVSVPVASAIAKTAALEAASEADSSEACLTTEQKVKAERLKRAKMFVAMLKSGAVPLKPESPHRISAGPQESGLSGSGTEVFNLEGKEREGSSVPLDVDTSDKKEKSETKYTEDDYSERLSRRIYRSRSKRDEDEEDEDEKDRKHSTKKYRANRYLHHEDCKEEEGEGKREHKHPKKKHRSYHSSHENEEERGHKHSRKKYHSQLSSHEGEDENEHDALRCKRSRKKHRTHSASHEEDDESEEESDRKHYRKKHRSHRSSHRGRDRHKHRKRHSSKERESQHRHKVDGSSNDECRDHSEFGKCRKKSHSDKEELEEGEINSKFSDQSRSVGDHASREASLDHPSAHQDGTVPSRNTETDGVSDDLRTKIRAMLIATL